MRHLRKEATDSITQILNGELMKQFVFISFLIVFLVTIKCYSRLKLKQ